MPIANTTMQGMYPGGGAASPLQTLLMLLQRAGLANQNMNAPGQWGTSALRPPSINPGAGTPFSATPNREALTGPMVAQRPMTAPGQFNAPNAQSQWAGPLMDTLRSALSGSQRVR